MSIEKKPLLVELDVDTHKALGHLAVERGTSKSALVREFIAAGLAPAPVPVERPAPRMALPSFVGTPVDDRLWRALNPEG